MDLNGLFARTNFWGKVCVYSPNGDLIYKTTRPNQLFFNKTTKIYRSADNTEWATIFNTSGRGMATFVHEIRQQDKVLARLETIRSRAAIGMKDKVSIQDADGKPLGFVNSNEKLGGTSLVFSSFTIFNERNHPIATIDNKDRGARVKLVISETFEITETENLDEKWQVIVVVILVLKTAGLISD